MSDGARRIEDLEARLAFQEKAIEELSDALAAARAELDRLGLRLKRVEDQLRAAVPGVVGDAADDPPPHY
jgi:SlyX protein